MGSLMAGWDSHVLDPKSETLERNRSLTKEEISAFWRAKKEIEEEHLKAVSKVSETIQTSKCEVSNKLHKSSMVHLARTKEESKGMEVDASLEHLIKKNDWWTKSSWAFLNEPPVTEAAFNKYASQFHVAKLGSSRDGISA
ncbi:uncharacterized protein LOC133300865 [Gastrolobium bilobum]|uniref:uncharacterized protein LOC133300865 n=1 Tax=Gastrolobium bilobum TaxID=150636 RepID=UPI002AB077EB|nr:uncharacterized protein LOC133300865 [Gastrolobium bilobum]